MPDRYVLGRSAPAGERALEALRAVVEGTVRASGEDFFPALCKALCRALDVPHALVGELRADGRSVAARAVCWDGELGEPFVYSLAGTPCEVVLGRGESVFVPSGVAAAFPDDVELARRGIEAYLGASLIDHAGRKVGALVVMSDRVIDPSRAPSALLEIFAVRAASELERLRLEQQLMRSQRLEGMGRLAAGVAHDFNNLLTVILSNAEFASAELPAGSPVRDYLAPIHDASHRATRLTRQLLSFARRQPSAPQVIDLGAELAAVLRLLERLLGDRVALESRLDEVWPVRIDPGQLEQVLVNLAINARDAMPDGGVIVVRTARESLDPARAGERGVAPGDWVRLTVSDDGVGMDEETRAHCFEPFYSTKGDRGTGLGLATCHGIVQQAGGQIWVESTPGHGTSVHVLLPAHSGAAAPGRRRGPEPAPKDARCGETVLVAEDDPTVQAVARRALERAGYRVLVASTGLEALLHAKREPGEIHALITDLAMPGMTGPELSAHARVIRPGLRVLFASGFADEVTVAALAEAGDPLLMKPFTPVELLKSVRELLDRQAV